MDNEGNPEGIRRLVDAEYTYNNAQEVYNFKGLLLPSHIPTTDVFFKFIGDVDKTFVFYLL